MFKVGQDIYWERNNVFGRVKEIRYSEKNEPFEWTVDFPGIKGMRFDLFKIEDLHETADDMFERLGYKKVIDDRDNLIYHKEFDYGIQFYKSLKQYFVGSYEDIKENEIAGSLYAITVDEHLAIHQKMIELGWLS